MSESIGPQTPLNALPSSKTTVLTKIAGVKYCQDAAVSAYIIVKWLGDNGKQFSKDLGPWKPINTEGQFVLIDEGIPDGAWVNFSSYVSAVGEYTYDTWFEHDKNAGKGTEFRQSLEVNSEGLMYAGIVLLHLYYYHVDTDFEGESVIDNPNIEEVSLSWKRAHVRAVSFIAEDLIAMQLAAMNGITKRHSTTGTSFGLERMTDFPGIGGSRSLNLPFNSIGFKCLSWDMEHWRSSELLWVCTTHTHTRRYPYADRALEYLDIKPTINDPYIDVQVLLQYMGVQLPCTCDIYLGMGAMTQ
ncbi:hypothetical protein PILCRDRAFT_92560 [Piloderma croceum F 1598]|uniref:Uncharacterized protein n=1 Tax=Piloderma croceum (strain F 1598) TaxID=765440 RepID=A0A0C3BAY4_PILCF|nr:hypothetical protein PILCRDRAFT_92560 [Piloderma croceum F 1598]